MYDSAYTSVSADTFQVVARLVQCVEPSFQIQVMNISKQRGAVDCGLYAITVLTSLAFDQDRTTLVYDQQAMRPHIKLKNVFCIVIVGCLMMGTKWSAVIFVMLGITKLVSVIRIARIVPGYAHIVAKMNLFNNYCCISCIKIML